MPLIQLDLAGLSKKQNVVVFAIPLEGDSEYVYDVTNEDVLVLDCTNNFCVVNLPLAADSKGRRFTFVKSDPTTKCIGLRTTPVDGVELSSDPIGGNWPYMVYKQYQSVTVVSDGQAYQIESVN